MSATPAPELESDPLEPRLVLPARSNPANAGMRWITSGWKLFMRAPLMWIISIFLVFLAAIAMNFVPILGSLAFQVLQGVIAAGFMVACHSLTRGDDFELEHLLAGFRTRFTDLLILGAIFVVAGLLIVMVFALFVGFSVLTTIMGGASEAALSTILASSISLLLGMLVSLALTVPLLAAYWFAPALIVLNGMKPVAAMKASFHGCFRNFLPFLVYGLVMMLLAILAAIPVGLGFLVWIPLAIASTYTAYRGIFTDEAEDAPVVTA
jgi:uncharacterized membrane protein